MIGTVLIATIGYGLTIALALLAILGTYSTISIGARDGWKPGDSECLVNAAIVAVCAMFAAFLTRSLVGL